jgi:hypothetical protein
MKNDVFWDIETQFVLHRRHISATESNQLMLCKVWGFLGGDYKECRLLAYKNPVRTTQETHYVSATESSRLMLRKISGFLRVDYKECRLLVYKNPVRTSQETHYFSVTESSQLMLCKIWGFHGDDYEECRLLGRCAVSSFPHSVKYLTISQCVNFVIYSNTFALYTWDGDVN